MKAPIAQIVSAILEQAMRTRSSDVHIEPMTGDTRVRYRIDGILQERLALPHALHDAVTSRIKILSDLKIDEKRIPQDGRFNFRMGDQGGRSSCFHSPDCAWERKLLCVYSKSQVVSRLCRNWDFGVWH